MLAIIGSEFSSAKAEHRGFGGESVLWTLSPKAPSPYAMALKDGLYPHRSGERGRSHFRSGSLTIGYKKLLDDTLVKQEFYNIQLL
ncbi:hypothetical protein ACPUYX_08325 [Desulfosporosinus sp. SYSU MS00001]|uniref:hypothetical protein n=1 Tax=Desulfosporosinus sp. SYSU MS00001 TaxID=3416284 RepID=UPI003CF96875